MGGLLVFVVLLEGFLSRSHLVDNTFAWVASSKLDRCAPSNSHTCIHTYIYTVYGVRPAGCPHVSLKWHFPLFFGKTVPKICTSTCVKNAFLVFHQSSLFPSNQAKSFVFLLSNSQRCGHQTGLTALRRQTSFYERPGPHNLHSVT